METHLSRDQVQKAVRALLKHLKAKAEEGANPANLLQEEELLSLQIGFKRIPEKASNKPRLVKLPNKLYKEESEICLIVRDNSKQTVSERIKKHEVSAIKKVTTLKKLNTKYKQFEARRALCDAYDLFLVDEAILPFLPKALGKSFFSKKKQPVPINITPKDLNGVVTKVVESTRVFIGHGPNMSVRIAHSGMTESQIIENILQGMEGVARVIPEGWTNVQSVHIKSTESVALPVYLDLGAEATSEEPAVAAASSSKAPATPAVAEKPVEKTKPAQQTPVQDSPKPAVTGKKRARSAAPAASTPAPVVAEPAPVVSEKAKETPVKPTPSAKRAKKQKQ